MPKGIRDTDYVPIGTPIVMSDKLLYRRLFGTMKKYPTPSLLASKIQEYFGACALAEVPCTIAGMTVSLGFSTKQELYRYRDHGEEYAAVINKAITAIEDSKNILLLSGSKYSAGALADLKNNHQWADGKNQTEITVDVGQSLADIFASLQGKTISKTLGGNVSRTLRTFNEASEDAVFEEVPLERPTESPESYEQDDVI